MGILDSISSAIGLGKEAKASTTQSGLKELLQLFPQLQGVGEDIIKRGVDIGNTTTPFATAPFTPLQNQGFNALGNYAPGKFKFDFGKKADAAYGLSRDLLSGVSPLISQASDYFRQGATPLSSGEISSSIGDFMNPFEDSVVQNGIRDISTYGNGLFSDARGLISDAGGSGSNRAGILAGDIADNLMKNVGDFSSSVRQTGFQSAAQNALTRLMGERGNALTAGSGSVSGANALTSAGGAAANLGSSLWDSRMGVDALQKSGLEQMLALANNRLTAGGQQQDFATQNNQIPLQQVGFLQGIMNGFPTSNSSWGGTAEQLGPVNRFLSSVAGK